MCIIEAVNSRNREAKSVVLVFVDYHEEVGRGGRKRTGGGGHWCSWSATDLAIEVGPENGHKMLLLHRYQHFDNLMYLSPQ